MGLWAAKGEELRQIAKVIQVANTRRLDWRHRDVIRILTPNFVTCLMLYCWKSFKNSLNVHDFICKLINKGRICWKFLWYLTLGKHQFNLSRKILFCSFIQRKETFCFCLLDCPRFFFPAVVWNKKLK